jgi:SAM-dependent methyltransferase
MIADLVQHHYAAARLEAAVRAASEADAADPAAEELAAFAGLHSRAQQATTELAELAGLQPGMRVLDVGSGLGGPARHLARVYGVRVTGIDVTPEYVRIARMLTRHDGLADRVVFAHGNAQSAPLPSDGFECVWIQHVLMNIAGKARLFRQLRRALVPGGTLALHEIVAPDAHRVRYPIPWARSPSTSFVPRPERLRTAIESAGFTLRAWKDTSAAATAWYGALADGPDDAPSLSLRMILGPDAGLMIRNLADNFAAGRFGAAVAVFTRVR